MFRRTFCAFMALALSAGAAQAVYPDKPVRLVVPFSPGGATDLVARALGARLSQMWKQQVVIDNRAGAGGNLGADIVAKSPADGYTLLMSSPAELTINPFVFRSVPFDAVRDFTPVTKVASAPLVLVVNAGKTPARTVQELVQALKASGGTMNFASSGTGGPQHLAGELFKTMAGVNMTHIPYKGGAPATVDLLGGQVDLFFSGVPPALPHIAAGKLRALAVTTEKRSELLPGVPSIAESGYPGFNIENWQGLFAPSGTPKEIVEQIARDVALIAADKSFAELLTAQGAVPQTMTPAAFAAFVQGERNKFSRLVKESGAKVD